MNIRFLKPGRGTGIFFLKMLLVAAIAEKSHGGQNSPGVSNRESRALAAQGRSLFLMNCAHCHGADATGDEGPDLHGLDQTDERLASLINNGKKGEMPKFSAKLGPAEVAALIAYLHTLK